MAAECSAVRPWFGLQGLQERADGRQSQRANVRGAARGLGWATLQLLCGSPLNTYLLLKTMHVVSAAVLLGTGAGIAFFTWFGYRLALRTGSIESLRNTLRLTVLGDLVFTSVAVVVQPLTGALMMRQAGWSFTSDWFIAVVALYLGTGACWLPVVWIQYRLRHVALGCDSTQGLPASFHRAFLIWFALGIPAFTMVLLLFWLMVAKPGL